MFISSGFFTARNIESLLPRRWRQ